MVEHKNGIPKEIDPNKAVSIEDDLLASANIPDVQTPIEDAPPPWQDIPPWEDIPSETLPETTEDSPADEEDTPVSETGENPEEPSDPQEDVLPDLDAEDWMSQLREDEIFNSKEGPCPRLHGLRRLAKPYVKTEESRVNHLIVVPKEYTKTLVTRNSANDIMSSNEELARYHLPMASVTFLITDIYGRTFSDSADAFYSNCNELGHFPTAVASTRAEARALRKLLGIKQHAAEEVTDKDAGEELAENDDSPAKPEQVKLIDKIISGLSDFSVKDLIGNITAREVYTAEEFTVGEARKALRLLNDQKKKDKRKKK